MQLGESLSEFGIPPLTAALTVIVAGLALFEPIGLRLGGHGASWNPATSACFAAAGKGSTAQHIIRMVGLCPAVSVRLTGGWHAHMHTLPAVLADLNPGTREQPNSTDIYIV